MSRRPRSAARPDRPARPRAEHLGPDARRPLVLDAALVVWSRSGHRGTTMAAVADEAEVSKPVVYECFATKDDMLLALLDREEGRLVSAAVDALPALSNDPREDLTRGFTAFFMAVLEHPLSWRVLVDAQRTVPTEIGERYRRARADVVERVAGLLRATDLRTAVMDPADVVLVAEHCVALAELGAARLLREDVVPTGVGASRWTPESLAASLSSLVIDGIG